jgi:hypothetical protein
MEVNCNTIGLVTSWGIGNRVHEECMNAAEQFHLVLSHTVSQNYSIWCSVIQ